MKIVFSFFALFFTYFLLSCSDDNSTNNDNTDYYWYLCNKTGNYRIEDVYKIDIDGNRQNLIRANDSTVWSQKQMVGDKECTVLMKYDTEGNVYMALPTYFDGTKVYLYPVIWKFYTDLYESEYGIDYPLKPAADELWLLVDFTKEVGEVWEGFPEKSCNEYPIAENATYTATIRYYGEITKEIKYEIDGKKYDTKVVETHFTVEGHSMIDGEKTEINVDYKQVYYFAYEAGIVLFQDFPFDAGIGYGPLPGGGEEWATKRVGISDTK